MKRNPLIIIHYLLKILDNKSMINNKLSENNGRKYLNREFLYNVLMSKNNKNIFKILDFLRNDNFDYVKNIVKSNYKEKIIGIFSWHPRNGGRSRVTVDLANKLCVYGYKVIYISTNYYSEKEDYVFHPNVIKETLYDYSGFNNRNANLITVLNKHKINLLIHNMVDIGEFLNDLIICKILDIKSLVFCHSSFSYYYITRNLNFLNDFIKCLSICDGLLVLNKMDYDIYKLFCNNIYLTYESIDYLRNIKVKSNVEKKYDICFIARCDDPIKHANDIIDVCINLKQKLSSFKIAVVGEINESFKDLISKYKLNDYIEIVGYQQSIFKYLSQSSIFLTLSISESFSMSVTEAFYFSKPVVMYKISYLPLCCSKGVFSTEIGNTKQVADYLYELIVDKNLSSSSGNENKKFLNNLYSDLDENEFWHSVIASVDENHDSTSCLDYLFTQKCGTDLYPFPNANNYSCNNISFKDEFRIFIKFIPRFIKKSFVKLKRIIFR